MGGPRFNWNNTTPAAPGGYSNVKWQSDGGSPIENISAYVPASSIGHWPDQRHLYPGRFHTDVYAFRDSDRRSGTGLEWTHPSDSG